MINVCFRSDRLRQRRLECGYTQETLAVACGVAYLTLTDWERGRREPHARTLVTLALVLHVDVLWLMNAQEERAA